MLIASAHDLVATTVRAAGQAAASEPAPILWYANRASGFVLLGLLTLTTAAGVLATSAPGSVGWPRAASQLLHRNLGLLSVVFLVVHVVTATVDEFVDIRWWHTLVPFSGSYQRPWLGLGVVALDLIVAAAVSGLLRHRMAHRWWRAVHLSAYAVWVLSLLHLLGMGTDGRTGWGLAVAAGCALVVAVAVGVRLGSARGRPPAAGAPTARVVTVSRPVGQRVGR